jgi:hypothetical protein
MSDDRDFAIDASDLQGGADLPADPSPDSASPPTPEPAPRVLIEYRSRGIRAALLPPLLILLAALGFTAFERQSRFRPLPPRTSRPAALAPGAASASPPGRIIMVEAAGTGAAVEPIAIRSAIPPPQPPPVVLASPAPSPPPSAAVAPEPPGSTREALSGELLSADPGPFSPFSVDASKEPRRKDEPPLEPPPPLVSTRGTPPAPDSPELSFAAGPRPGLDAPGQEPKPTKEQILKEIELEAQQKTADQQHLAREVDESKYREFVELLQKTYAERRLFHDELRRALRELGDDAGTEIKAICDRYGRETHPVVEKKVRQDMSRWSPRLTRAAKIEKLRADGLPETRILDFLASELDGRINTRGGPTDQNGVRVLAAQRLLTFPPHPVPEVKATAAPRTTAARKPATP